MEKRRNVIVILASEVIGKPVGTAIARTFEGYPSVDVKNLTTRMVTNFMAAENIFADVINKAREIVKNDKEENIYFLVAAGSVIQAILAFNVLSKLKDRLYLLVWERTEKKYMCFDRHGRRYDIDEILGKETFKVENEETENEWKLEALGAGVEPL